MSSERVWPWLLPVVLLLLFIGIYPFLYNIWNSFQEFNPMTGRVEPVGFDNWRRLLEELTSPDGRARNSLIITASYVTSALIVEFVLGLGIATLLNSGVWGAGGVEMMSVEYRAALVSKLAGFADDQATIPVSVLILHHFGKRAVALSH